MKSLKKTLALLVVLSMVFSAISPVFAFSDTIPEGYEEQVNKMAAMGVIAGDDNGNFNAESEITRAQMAVIICKMTGITEEIADANKMTPSKFSDVEVGQWYTGWINLAVNNGVISGFPDGTFRPSEKLTTNQALTLVVKALGRGTFVDKMGTWPGNYVQDAAKLGITKDMVATGSELANRGNVAIICYNALTVGTWDVTSTTLDGEVRLSSDVSLLGKYFKDYAQNIGTKANPDYDFKMVENITVTATPLQDTKIGTQQVIFDYDDLKDVEAADFKAKPRKDYETATYYTLDNQDEKDTLVAYVPESVCENVGSLYGKKVDVLFGKDNEVALITVVDDTVNAAYVTAWDADNEEIEVNDEVYELASTVTVKVFGKQVYSGTNAKTTLNNLFETTLGIEKPKAQFNRSVIADLIFNDDGEVSTIDLRFSAAYSVDAVSVEEKVVKTITSKGAVKDLDGNTIFADIEELEDVDDPRVIKADELVSLADIDEGNVLTIVRSNGKVVAVFVSDTTVAGTVTSIKNRGIKIDDTAYNKVDTLYGDLSGKFEDATTDALDLDKYDDEEVEVYLNFAGEVSVIVADTNLESMVFGVIAETVVVGDDVIEDTKSEIDYLRIKVYTKDAGRAKSYYVYNEKSNKHITEASNWSTVLSTLSVGTPIVYSADADKKILSDEIFVVEDDEIYTVDQKELTAVEFANGDITEENYDRKTAKIDSTSYRFSNLVAAYNTHDGKIETVKGWDSLCDDGNNFVTITSNAIALVDGSTVKYLVANIASYATLDDTRYAVLTDVDKNEDNDAIVTLYIDGEEVTFELDGLVADRTRGTVTYTSDSVNAAITTAKATLTTAKADLATAKTALTTAETALTTAKTVKTAADALVDFEDVADDSAAVAAAEDYADALAAVKAVVANDSIEYTLTAADAALPATEAEANAEIAKLNADIAAVKALAAADVTAAQGTVDAAKAEVTAKEEALADAEEDVADAEAGVVVAEVGDFVTYELTDGDVSAIAVVVNAKDFTTDEDADVMDYISGSEIVANGVATITRDHLRFDALEDGNVIVYQEVDDKRIGDNFLDEDYIVYDLREIDDDAIEMYTGDFTDLEGEIVVGFAEEVDGDVTVLVILK